MRLIDADKLKEEFYNRKRTPDDMKYMRVPVEVVYQFIDNAPTVEMPNWYKVYEDVKSTFERPQGEWIVTAEDNDGVHRICCPFCSYEKGSNNTDPIIVTFTNFPKFCENCGADMRGGAE